MASTKSVSKQNKKTRRAARKEQKDSQQPIQVEQQGKHYAIHCSSAKQMKIAFDAWQDAQVKYEEQQAIQDARDAEYQKKYEDWQKEREKAMIKAKELRKQRELWSGK